MLGQMITIIVSILIVIVVVFLVSKYQLWFAKRRLLMVSIFVILGIAIYTIGYLEKNPKGYFSSALMAIFSTGRMFVFENDLSSFETEVTKLTYYNGVFGLIMTLSMLTTGMVVLSFFGYRVMCKIQLKFLRFASRKKKIFIFTKLNEKALLLADDIKKKNNKSIIMFCINDLDEEDEVKSLEKKVAERGFIVLPVNSNFTMSKICKQFLKNKIAIFAISEEDNENVSFVNEFAGQLNVSKKKNPNISIYAFLKNSEYEDYFQKDIFSGLDIHIIDENDLSSRQLFDKFTLISCIGDTNTLTVCVIGYTDISEDLYRNISFLGQFEGVKLKIILIDEMIQDKTAIFFNKNMEIKKCADFECLDMKLNTEEFYEYFNHHMEEINCVIISDDNRNTATEISRISSYKEHKIKLCLHVKDYDKYNLLFETHLLKDVITFGSKKDIYTESIIINEKLDMLAKGVHNYYVQLYHDPRAWNDISLFDKQSNRALALHFQSKLHSIGLRYTPGGDIHLFDELIKDHVLLENLSKGEHLRWNAYSYANGWRTMKNIQNQVKNKDSVKKTHSCLVDWDQLDIISKKYEKDYKEMDRHLIRNMGNTLSSVGFGIEKME